ncbi:hypothetical protein JCM3774_003059 [Rhodotorula dairenensis]
MAAFQQRRQHQRDHLTDASLSPVDVDEPATSCDLAADDGAVLLFGSQSATASASWSVVRPPRSARTTSFTSSRASSSFPSADDQAYATDTSADAPSSLGSPVSFRQASLLPAHAGDGVFFAASASAGSLVMSDDTATEDSGDFSERDAGIGAAPVHALFPSVYADLHVTDSSSDDGGGGGATTFSAYSFVASADRQRHTASSTTYRGGTGSLMSDTSEWALTEAALSTHRALGGDRDDVGYPRAEDEDRGSVAFTTSTSESESNQVQVGRDSRQLYQQQQRRQERSASVRAQALGSAEREDEDWAHSPLALSAGFLPPSRRPRRAPPPSSFVREGEGPPAPPITLLLPRGSSLRSLSPVASLSARSRRSSSSLGGSAVSATGGVGSGIAFKRRHRQAGTGRSSTSQKRSAGGVSLVGQALVLEQIAREEEDRARRMTAILEQRRDEAKTRDMEAKILFGHAIRNYMSIDPVSLALLAEADPVPLATIECTPTPSRAQSPSNAGGLHGTAAFVAHAIGEARFPGAAGTWARGGGDDHDDEEEDDSGAETETEHESDRAARWTKYSVRPKVAAAAATTTGPLARSRSASELGLMLFTSPVSPPAMTGGMGTFSPITGSGLTARTRSGEEGRLHRPPPPPPLQRRSSSFSGSSPTQADHSSGRPVSLSVSSLSHEERIMLGLTTAGATSGSTMTTAGCASSPPSVHSSASFSGHGAAAPWGGDVDSFELALNYWKRMWRRLRGSGGGGGGPSHGGGLPITTVAAPTLVTTTTRSTTRTAPAAAKPPARPVSDLLVPEAHVGVGVGGA